MKLRVKLGVSSSAWLEADVEHSNPVVELSDGYSIRSGEYRPDVPAYYLFDGSKLAGHVCFFPNADLYWMDKVFLEPEYRGTGLAKILLTNALSAFRSEVETLILVDGFYKHVPLYAGLGFKLVLDRHRYTEDLDWHHNNFKYTHPKKQYRLMILD